MLCRVNTYLNQRYVVAGAIAGMLLSAPALGLASADGGSSSGGGAAPSGGGVAPAGSQPSTQSGNRTVSASGNGVTITTHASGFMNRELKFTGSVSSSEAGKVVEIERAGRHTNGQWLATTHATVGRNGSFTAFWHANRPGALSFRAALSSRGDRAGGSALSGSTASSWPTVDVIVYRLAVATIYGPGFWGQQTACGQTLRRGTLGVAHRTLPCGTLVSIYYRGHTIRVPVIDRGPYANGADWDLTEATARALGMDGTAQVGGATIGR